MEMSKMVALIIGVTVSIVIFVSVLAPVIIQYTTNTGTSEDPVYAVDDPTLRTLIIVCGTLTVIAILMMVVRALGNRVQ